MKQQGLTLKWLQSAGMQRLPSLRSFRAPVLVAIAYYLGAQAAFSIGTLSDRIFAPFWPPNVILFCTLLVASKRRWWLYIAAAFPAHVIAEITVGMPAAQLIVAFVTNCMVAILSAVGIRRFCKQSPSFGTLRNAAIYILIVGGISPAAAAFGGAFVQILGGGAMADYWIYWANWGIANALGSVTLGPVFLVWLARPDTAPVAPRRKIEAVVLAISLVSACALAFHAGQGIVNTGFVPALLYSPLPLILWAAFRFGERGASGAILIITVVSIWGSLHGQTLFMAGNASMSVLALQIFLLGVAIPVILLGAAIDELRRSEEATRGLAGSLLQAQDEERRRIARELHDSTGQNLAIASLMAGKIQRLAPASCEPVIAELKDVLQSAITEIRTFSYLLHPPLLDAGLGVALQPYLDGFSKRTGIEVEQLELSPNLKRMSSEVEVVLFRVIQEALTNIWRHSGSKTARIQLVAQVVDSRPQITLSIEDAGKGIPADIRLTLSRSNGRELACSGLGLLGMRERLRQIGGQLQIDSTTGRTVIRAIVPLNEDHELEA